MHEDQHAAPESRAGATEAAERALAELPDQLARARAALRQAREQLSIQLGGSPSEERL